MTDLLTKISGYKTYIVCVLGILAVLVNHFIAPIPGVDVDQGNWLDQIWTLILIMCGRSALHEKTEPSK